VRENQLLGDVGTTTTELLVAAPEQKLYPELVVKDTLNPQKSSAEVSLSKTSTYARAPEITNPSGFINTNDRAITLTELVGKKVVLVSFWTYSCINCQRTLPYLNTWYEKYSDQGLEL
jgi:thiol-disulfide isomerase/thioredoxin